jgi:hypothetical protein
MWKIQQIQLTSNSGWRPLTYVSDEPNKIGRFNSFISAEKQIQFLKHLNRLRYNYSCACV